MISRLANQPARRPPRPSDGASWRNLHLVCHKVWRRPGGVGRSLGPVLVLSLLAAPFLKAAEPQEPLARPPEFPREVVEVFFGDAREQLSGPRPNYEQKSFRGIARDSAALPSDPGSAAPATGFEWSRLIVADAVETEIKRQLVPLQPLVSTPSTFKGGAYRECRDRFNTLAVMFAVAADYDDPVRWQDSAGLMSRAFARASANCKVGTDQSYREAQQRVSDLAELVRGGRPSVVAPAQDQETWEGITDRTPMMVRMEQAFNERVSPNLASGRDLSANGDELRHEAQLLALFSHILIQPGLPDAGDEAYDGYARQLRDNSISLIAAIDQEDFTAARAALGQMSKACAACHDEYR